MSVKPSVIKAVNTLLSAEKIMKDVAVPSKVPANETAYSNTNEKLDEELPRDIFEIDINPVDGMVDGAIEPAYKRPKTKDSHLSVTRFMGSIWNSHNL